MDLNEMINKKLPEETKNRLLEMYGDYEKNPIRLPVNLTKNLNTPDVPQYNKKIFEETKNLNSEITKLRKQLNKGKWMKWVNFAISIISILIAIAAFIKSFY
jgi:hypothetical protein